ncbi:glycosyltransferase [Candidatus Bathyarchaeota archaeon]|nr:glycosyltransferase [Candidatus Bathyarchaeota archaeon]
MFSTAPTIHISQRIELDLKISAVIPLYNEDEVIDEFAERLVESLNRLGLDYEVIFVVEGTDSTLDKVTALTKNNPRIRVEYCEERLGLGKAMKKGLGLIGADSSLVLTMDADLNHDPKEIRSLLEASKSADVVVGSRSMSRGFVKELPWFKRMVSASTNWVLRNAFDIQSGDVTSGFRIYARKVVESVRDELVSKNFEVTAELLIRAKKKGFSIAEVPITFRRRPRGTSKLSFVKSGVGYVILLFRLGA